MQMHFTFVRLCSAAVERAYIYTHYAGQILQDLSRKFALALYLSLKLGEARARYLPFSAGEKRGERGRRRKLDAERETDREREREREKCRIRLYNI